MHVLEQLEDALLTKNAAAIPDIYKDDIDIEMLHHEFALFKTPTQTVSEAVGILQKMYVCQILNLCFYTSNYIFQLCRIPESSFRMWKT